ncbi:alpha/beta-hydrolase [Apiospora saccharicola]
MVSLTDGQKATLSPEAIEFLTNIHHVPFAQILAPFIASPRRVPELRRGLVVTIAGLSVAIITPANVKPEKQNKLLFNVFGGATIMGSPRDRGALTMAAELGVRVCSPDYTKAPEARYPVARDQCLAVYRELIRKGLPCPSSSPSSPRVPVNPADMYAMGSSSGAQVLVSMLLVARREGLPMPTAGLYLCTPALDLSGAGDSMTSNARDRDIMSVSLLTAMVTQNYVPLPVVEIDRKGFGGSTDPLYSPLYADYGDEDGAAPWFPRTVMTVGTRDFALSHGVRFYWKLREAGVEVELLVSEGMWHGFNWDPKLSEALTARAAVVEFFERQI